MCFLDVVNGLAENRKCFDCAQRKPSKTDAANREVVKSLPIDNQVSTKHPRMRVKTCR